MRRCWGFCVCLCLASCSRSTGWAPEHPAYPTSGQVLVNGEPAAGAVVVFYHQGDWGAFSIVPQAKTGSSGQFVLSTYAAKDGAPAGDYQVTVEWPAYIRGKEWGPDKLGGKYAKRETSALKVRVEKGPNKLAPLELKISAAQAKLNEAAAAKKKRRKIGNER